MRVLWMKSDFILPPDTGGKIRTYNLMRELRRLCDVTYLCFKGPGPPEPEGSIAECADRMVSVVRAEEQKSGPAFYGRVLRGIASRRPYIVQKYRSSTLASRERELVLDHLKKEDQPVVILCDFLEMAENVAWELPCPKVLFQHNVESEIWHQYYMNERNPLKKAYWDFERRRMKRYESATCNRFDAIFAVSEEDRLALRRDLGVQRPIEVLPTGVDTDFFAPRPDITPIPGRLVFLGSLDWMPNIDGVRWFVRDIYPRLRAQHPGVSLDIVGRRPTDSVLRAVRGDPSIRVIADVPDVRPHIAAADLFVVPLRIGGGTRIKIFEAMAMGRPVVATTLGAQGLGLSAGRHVGIGDTPTELADEINRLLWREQDKLELAAAGYRLVTEHRQWRHVAHSLHARCAALWAESRSCAQR